MQEFDPRTSLCRPTLENEGLPDGADVLDGLHSEDPGGWNPAPLNHRSPNPGGYSSTVESRDRRSRAPAAPAPGARPQLVRSRTRVV